MNLPNLITLARLFVVPVTVWLVIEDRFLAAFWVFIGAGISDAVDGFLARQMNARTTLGAFMDPLADKALLVSVYVALGYTGYLPDWLVILVVFRDVMIIGGVILMVILTGKVEMQPIMISKINTTLQIVLAGLVLGDIAFGLSLGTVQLVLVYTVAVTTLLSGAAYVLQLGRRAPDLEDAG
ncbi:MAG: CDP-alcohol phosphatidyltransferase family protein [Alphaproteobacteria bacterium]|nr:CDP-alcohol phosphatidyltransferase family protein [Alphaproteobacteria bacterium]